MTLDINGNKQITSPSSQDIRQAVLAVDEFLILGSTSMTYIQCSGDAKGGFILEYQEESIDQHYRAKRSDWDAETIITKFSQYAEGDPSWKEGVAWEDCTW